MAVVVPIISTFDAKGVTRAIADFKKLNNAGDKTQFALGTTNKAVSTLGKNFAKFGGIAAGVVGVVGGGLVRAAYESQKVMKQTEAIIAATGGAANLTATQVGDLSEKLSNQTGVDDELIQSSLNLLLTFKAVRNEMGAGNDIFNRAAQASLDLGNVFGSTDAAAVQLGKALSNPLKGVSALRKSGVDFTEQQIAQIKTLVQSGKILDAQKMILAEVESQVGGTAAAGATGFDRMRVAIGNAAEDLGGVLIPYVEQFANYVITNVVPVVSEFADIVGKKGLGAGIEFLADGFFNATANMGTFGNVALGVIATMTALKLILLAATVAQVAFNVALLSNPIGIAVAAVIVLGVALVALAVKFKVVRDIFKVVWNAIIDATQFAIDGILGGFNNLTNGAIIAINILIKAWNAIPFTNKIDELEQVNFALDITAAKVKGAGAAAVASAADFRKFEEAQKAAAKVEEQKQFVEQTKIAQETFKKFGESARSVVADQKNLREALKNTASAQKSLQTATDNVATAQAKLNKIASGYGTDSAEAKTAQDELTKATRDARQAGFDLTKANYAVTDAEDALNKARMRNNPREITEAEIALEEARISQSQAQEAVTTTTDAVNVAQTNLNETINGAATTSDTYKNALIELQSAQDAQVEAIDKMRDAKERELEVTRNLAKAEILLRKAKGKLTKSQRAAADKLLTELNTPVTVTVPTATGGSVAPVSSGSGFSGIDFSGFSVGGLATLAEGGIVTRPTFALIGEGGESEAVIPLSKMGGMIGSGTTINVTVTSADPNAVVDALRRYQRQNGALPLRVTG